MFLLSPPPLSLSRMISTDFVARDKNCPGKGKVKKGGQGLTVLYIGPISRHSSGESRRIKVKRAGKYTQESISSLPSICLPGWNIAGGGEEEETFQTLSLSLPLFHAPRVVHRNIHRICTPFSASKEATTSSYDEFHLLPRYQSKPSCFENEGGRGGSNLRGGVTGYRRQ